MLARKGVEVGGQKGREVQGANLARSVTYTHPEESRKEDEVEESGYRLGRVGVQDPCNRVGFELLELRARAGDIVTHG